MIYLGLCDCFSVNDVTQILLTILDPGRTFAVWHNINKTWLMDIFGPIQDSQWETICFRASFNVTNVKMDISIHVSKLKKKTSNEKKQHVFLFFFLNIVKQVWKIIL